MFRSVQGSSLKTLQSTTSSAPSVSVRSASHTTTTAAVETALHSGGVLQSLTNFFSTVKRRLSALVYSLFRSGPATPTESTPTEPEQLGRYKWTQQYKNLDGVSENSKASDNPDDYHWKPIDNRATYDTVPGHPRFPWKLPYKEMLINRILATSRGDLARKEVMAHERAASQLQTDIHIQAPNRGGYSWAARP